VAAAVKEAVGLAVQEAVQAVLAEVLTNADLLAQLARLVAPAAPPVQQAPARPAVRQRLGRAAAWVGGKARAFADACRALTGTAVNLAAVCWARLRLLRHLKYQLLAAAGVGVAAGLAAYWAGPVLAALASGAGGFATTWAVQAGLWLRRLLAGAALPQA
jgi:hypothetical protein